MSGFFIFLPLTGYITLCRWWTQSGFKEQH